MIVPGTSHSEASLPGAIFTSLLHHEYEEAILLLPIKSDFPILVSCLAARSRNTNTSCIPHLRYYGPLRARTLSMLHLALF